MSVRTFTGRFGASRPARWLVAAPTVRRFNPSLLLGERPGDVDLLAHRSWTAEASSPKAVLETYRGGMVVDRRDLTSECAAFEIPRVADPKLFRLRGEPWMTFNTGSTPGGNELYLRRLVDPAEPPIRCDLDDRLAIEKNWQFVESSGRLMALYSVEPLVLLDGSIPAADSSSIRFRHRNDGDSPTTGNESSPSIAGVRRRLVRRTFSVGSPLLAAGDRRFRLIVHEKWHVVGKRWYVARAAELDVAGVPTLTLGRHRFVHSAAGCVGTWPRLNPNLISCTYVSGLSGDPESPLVSMGVNDAWSSFAACTWEELFGR